MRIDQPNGVKQQHSLRRNRNNDLSNCILVAKQLRQVHWLHPSPSSIVYSRAPNIRIASGCSSSSIRAMRKEWKQRQIKNEKRNSFLLDTEKKRVKFAFATDSNSKDGINKLVLDSTVMRSFLFFSSSFAPHSPIIYIAVAHSIPVFFMGSLSLKFGNGSMWIGWYGFGREITLLFSSRVTVASAYRRLLTVAPFRQSHSEKSLHLYQQFTFATPQNKYQMHIVADIVAG